MKKEAKKDVSNLGAKHLLWFFNFLNYKLSIPKT
jgi:hypothetical protein